VCRAPWILGERLWNSCGSLCGSLPRARSRTPGNSTQSGRRTLPDIEAALRPGLQPALPQHLCPSANSICGGMFSSSRNCPGDAFCNLRFCTCGRRAHLGGFAFMGSRTTSSGRARPLIGVACDLHAARIPASARYGRERRAEDAKGDPAYARQPILSVPPEADNRSQTIVVPPDLKLDPMLPSEHHCHWNDRSAVPLDAAPARLSRQIVPKFRICRSVAPAPDGRFAPNRVVQAAMASE